MNNLTNVNRRDFLVTSAAVGGGLMLGFHLPAANAATEAPEVNAWIVIKPDDSVIIRVAHSEMGQGSFTALPMLVAEELDCDWSKVTAEFASPVENLKRNKVYGAMATVGSRAVRTSHEYLRKAGAGAREVLIAAAARQWKVPAGQCRAERSIITHTPTGRTVSFGAVADAAAKLPAPKDVALKDPKDWKLVGTPVKRLDIADKVLAKPVFAMDAHVPDLLYAAIAHSPVFGGKMASYDEAAIRRMKGFKAVVPFENAVAVVAESYWHAEQALKALPITWNEGENAKVSSADIAARLTEGLSATDAAEARNDGDVKGVLAKATKVIEAEYFAPFLSHAPMEPQTCTVRFVEGGVEIWAPTQNAEASMNIAAQAAGVEPAKVVVHPTMAGGGFGRRGGSLDYVHEAVSIAKAIGKPIKLVWSREEDIQHDYYRPISSAKFKAAVDADGNISAWATRVSGQSIVGSSNPGALKGKVDMGFLVSFTDNSYTVPNLHVDYAMRNTHVPVGYWRSVNHSQNGFFRECFVDELATAAGADPYEFRRKHLQKSPKQLAVLDAAAKAAEWGKPLPQGVHRGIAQVDGYGSYVAAVAEVSMDAKNWPRVHRVVIAVDCGYVVNPDTVASQLEGSVVWMMSAMMYGEITIKNGRVEQGNFNTYPMLRMDEMPKVEVVLAPSGGFWGGIGEPGGPPVTPAILNAMFQATGKRVRSLPLRTEEPRSA